MSERPDRHEDWCVHYCGLGGTQPHMTAWEDADCRAGVVYITVRQDRPGATNHLDRMPCFKHNNLPCPHQRFKTPEEIAEGRQKDTDAIKAYVTALDDGRCPHCGKVVEREEQIGRCVYARPCGHRMYQGRAKGVSEAEYESLTMDW